MDQKKAWQKQVLKVYKKIKEHKNPYEIEVNGLKITVFPNVFSPKYFVDSSWFAKELPLIVEKNSLLEIGTGTGIISLSCALKGADVTFTDLNEDAIKNAKYNFEKHKLKFENYEGDIYEAIPKEKKYDFIFWAHPFNKGTNPNEDILLKAGFDFNYESLEKYISETENHLSNNGRLLLGTGDFADLDYINTLSENNNRKMTLLKQTELPLDNYSKIMNRLMIYELKKGS